MGERMTFKRFVKFIKLLRIDIFFLLFSISFSLPSVTLNQLIEDKICLNTLNLDRDICLNLEKTGPSHETEKNFVLEKSAIFKNYQIGIITAPGLILSFFIGYWIDSYPRHLKYLVASPALGGVIGCLIVIYNCFHFQLDYRLLLMGDVPRGFSGGFAAVFTGTYTYITKKTPPHFRAIRFAILEFFMFVASPLSVYIGGNILSMKPFIANQPRNYIGVYMVSAVCSFLAFLWIMIFLNDADVGPDGQRQKKSQIGDQVDSSNNEGDEIDLPEKENCCQGFSNTFLDIFNVSNIVSMVKTCTKQRENGCKSRLWHSMFMMAVVLLCYMGETTIGFPFAQRVYNWDSTYYSDISSALMVIPALGNTLISPFLVRKLRFTDTSLGLLGCLSLFSSMIIRGGWLTPYGYFFATVSGMFSGLMPIAIRSIISRLINFDEIGQVFALMSCVESCTPLLSSLFYSTIFAATIDRYPGMIYHVASIALFYPFVIMLWLDLTKSKWYHQNEPKAAPKANDEAEFRSESIDDWQSAQSYGNVEAINSGSEVAILPVTHDDTEPLV